MHKEKHYTNRGGWLRAVVLGANDGIVSTASLIIGVAAANSSRDAIILAGLASLIGGAASMAAGEYVSVSSQADVEHSDLAREKFELETMPDQELKELAEIYKNRGLDKDLALQVAKQLTEHNALEAHARDELGINEITQARPLQAALASAFSFIIGGLMPFMVSLFAPLNIMIFLQYGLAVLFLAVSAAVSARMGGSSIGKAIMRICFWSTVAMAATALVGYLFGVNVG